MSTVTTPTVKPSSVLRAFAEESLRRCEVSAGDAAIAADSLIEASLRGVDTHGVTSLLGIYVRRLRVGAVNPVPEVRVVSESAAAVVLDGDNGLGAVVGHKAVHDCITRAAATGAAWVGVRHSNHFGATGYYSMMAAAAGHVGIALTNGPPSMAPWGGVTKYMSTNPLSIALPADGDPVVLDMATSVVARFQVIQAATRGDQQIPEGWALDSRGRPTTDPQEALEGLIMPLGGHKGYGLSMMIDVLCGVLTGAAFGPYIGSLRRELDRSQNVGHLFGAIDITRLLPLDAFKSGLAQMCREIHASELAEGSDRVYVPGEIEAERRRQRLKEGIPVPEEALEDFRQIARELRISSELID